MGSAPFGILAALFEKLQTERKHDRRRKLLSTWLKVCLIFAAFNLHLRSTYQHWRDEKGHDLYPVLRLILPQASAGGTAIKPKPESYPRKTVSELCTA